MATTGSLKRRPSNSSSNIADRGDGSPGPTVSDDRFAQPGETALDALTMLQQCTGPSLPFFASEVIRLVRASLCLLQIP